MLSWIKKLFSKADVNKDGKVNSQDVKQVAAEVKSVARTSAAKVKIAQARKSKSKKTTK